VKNRWNSTLEKRINETPLSADDYPCPPKFEEVESLSRSPNFSVFSSDPQDQSLNLQTPIFDSSERTFKRSRRPDIQGVGESREDRKPAVARITKVNRPNTTFLI
jgi:hypothetical protein